VQGTLDFTCRAKVPDSLKDRPQLSQTNGRSPREHKLLANETLYRKTMIFTSVSSDVPLQRCLSFTCKCAVLKVTGKWFVVGMYSLQVSFQNSCLQNKVLVSFICTTEHQKVVIHLYKSSHKCCRCFSTYTSLLEG
jgi:phosphopantetheinyl transferase